MCRINYLRDPSGLTGAVPGNKLTFAIVVENQGHALKGAYDVKIKNTLPDGFSNPINISVTNGAGGAVNIIGNYADLFGTGLELKDPAAGAGVGALAPIEDAMGHPTIGTNIIVITYDVTLAVDVHCISTNMVEVLSFSNHEGGDVFVSGDNYVHRFASVQVVLVGPYLVWAATYLPDDDVSIPAADTDHDGVNNLAEYAFGLNPTSGSSLNAFVSGLKSSNIFIYTRRIDALVCDPPSGTPEKLTFTIYYSCDLEHWIVESPVDETILSSIGGIETVEAKLGQAAANAAIACGGKLFVRIKAEYK